LTLCVLGLLINNSHNNYCFVFTPCISLEGIGCQTQTAPKLCQHSIRWPSQAFTRWRHLSTHPINRPATHLSTPEG